MGNLIYKNKYDNKAINFNEKLIQIERDICNEKETDNPFYYIKVFLFLRVYVLTHSY